MPSVLDRELQTFDRERDRLLASAEGKYVLVRGDEVVGVYDTKMDAVTEGYRRFGNVPFLAKQLVRVEVPQTFVTNLIGL